MTKNMKEHWVERMIHEAYLTSEGDKAPATDAIKDSVLELREMAWNESASNKGPDKKTRKRTG